LSKYLLYSEIEDLLFNVTEEERLSLSPSLFERLLTKWRICAKAKKKCCPPNQDSILATNEEDNLLLLLGLSRNEILPPLSPPEDSVTDEHHMGVLRSLLLRRLRGTVHQLKDLISPPSPSITTPRYSDDISLLYEHVKQQKLTQDQVQQQIQATTEAVLRLYQQYHQTLRSCFTLLTQLLEEYKIKAQQYDHTIIKQLHTKAQVMLKKLVVLELQLANAMYTTESVTALREIRCHLERRIEELQRAHNEGQKRLESYRQLPGFEVLARQYAQLLGRIQEKRWVLEQLQQSDDNNETITITKS
jgi:hypothetical protein